MTEQTAIDTSAQEQPQQDRRVHHQVRAVFEQAWALMEPMLKASEGKPAATGFALAIELRNHFPELSHADLHLLVSTAMRIQRNPRPIAPARETPPKPRRSPA